MISDECGASYCRRAFYARLEMRYDAGERPVPAVLLDHLYGLLIKRHADIGKLLLKIRVAS